MPDLAVSPPTGLYPQPPSGQGALSSNPGQILDLIGKMQQNELLRRELAGRAALGQAYQGALNPDLSLDPQKFRSGLANNPDAMWMAPQATQNAQTLVGTQLENFNRQKQILSSLIGALGPNATNEQVYSQITTAVRMGVSPQLAVPALDSIVNSTNRGQAIGIWRSQGMSPGEQSARITGPPAPAGMFSQTGGEPTTIPLSAANVGGTIPTALPPTQPQSMAAMQADQARVANYPQQIFPWQQALQKTQELKAKYGEGVFGPGSEGRQEFASWLYAADPSIARWLGVDPEKLKNYDEARKYMVNALQARGAAAGAHSDQQWATAMSGTPNVHMNDLAAEDLLKAIIGLQRAEKAQVGQAAKRSGTAGSDYLSQKTSWPQQNDIRAFSYDLLSPDAQAKLLGSLKKGTPEYQRFNNSLRAAYETGVMDRSGVAPAATPTRIPAAAPLAAKAPPKPAVPGVQLGRRADGSQGWFIPDPNRPGKHLEVTLPGLGQ